MVQNDGNKNVTRSHVHGRQGFSFKTRDYFTWPCFRNQYKQNFTHNRFHFVFESVLSIRGGFNNNDVEGATYSRFSFYSLPNLHFPFYRYSEQIK